MRELIDQRGPTKRIQGTGVRVIFHSRAPGRVHAGTYIVNHNTWRVNSAIYPVGPHTCHSMARGCVPAIQLRALCAALRSARRSTTFRLEFSSHEAALLVRQWQQGNLTPPAWFTQVGKNGGWLPKLSRVVAFNPAAFTIKTVDLTHVRWGKQTKAIVDALINTSAIRHPGRREAAASQAILPLFSQLPL